MEGRLSRAYRASVICSAADRIPSGVRSTLIHTRCWSGAGTGASSSRTGISRVLPTMRRATAASSSWRTQGLTADDAETPRGAGGVEAFLEQLPDEAVARPDLPDVQPRRDAHLRELARKRLDET